MAAFDNSERYFLNWVNMHLKPSNIQISSFATDFANGTTFVTFLENVGGKKAHRKMVEPKNEIFKLQNCQVGIEMAKTMVKNLMINGRNLISGQEMDVKLVVGFIFDLVLHFQVEGIQLQNDQGKQVTGKEGLLTWCQQKVNKHNDVDVQNFSHTWQNGMAFIALIHEYNNKCVDFNKEQNDFNKQQSLSQAEQLNFNRDRLNRAFDLIKQELDVEKILDSDFASSPNDKANITYLSMIYQAINKQKKESKTSGAISKLIKRARQVEQMTENTRKTIQEFKDLFDKADSQLNSYDQQQSKTVEQIQNLIKEIFEKSRSFTSQLSQKIDLIEGQIEAIEQTCKNYGFKSQLQLNPSDQVKNLEQKVPEINHKSNEIITKLKLQISDLTKEKYNVKVQEWKILFDKFCKDGTYIKRDELEQLLIASSQEVNNKFIDPLYANNQKVNFDTVCHLLDQLESDNDTDEVVVSAFKEISNGAFVTKGDLEKLKLNNDELSWILGKMQEYKGDQGGSDKKYDFQELIKKIYQ